MKRHDTPTIEEETKLPKEKDSNAQCSSNSEKEDTVPTMNDIKKTVDEEQSSSSSSEDEILENAKELFAAKMRRASEDIRSVLDLDSDDE